MLEQIFFVVIVLAVGSLMAVDVARTRHEGSHGHAEGQVPEPPGGRSPQPAWAAAKHSPGPTPGRRCPSRRTTQGQPGILRAPAHPLVLAGADPRSHASAAAVPANRAAG